MSDIRAVAERLMDPKDYSDDPMDDAHELAKAYLAQQSALAAFVEDLADGFKWNWTRGCSYRDAADAALRLMGKLGLVEHRHHRFGGSAYRVNGQLFGRLDEPNPFETPTVPADSREEGR